MGDATGQGSQGRELFGLDDLVPVFLHLEGHAVEGVDEGADFVVGLASRNGPENAVGNGLGRHLDGMERGHHLPHQYENENATDDDRANDEETELEGVAIDVQPHLLPCPLGQLFRNADEGLTHRPHLDDGGVQIIRLAVTVFAERQYPVHHRKELGIAARQVAELLVRLRPGFPSDRRFGRADQFGQSVQVLLGFLVVRGLAIEKVVLLVPAHLEDGVEDFTRAVDALKLLLHGYHVLFADDGKCRGAQETQEKPADQLDPDFEPGFGHRLSRR